MEQKQNFPEMEKRKIEKKIKKHIDKTPGMCYNREKKEVGMMKNEKLQVTITPEMMKKIKAEESRTGMKTSMIVMLAIENYFGMGIVKKSSPKRK